MPARLCLIGGVPKKGESLFGAWQGWYVVHYGELVGYAAAAYIDA